MPLRAVFFDIDDTLYSTSEFAALARRNAMQAMVDLGLRLTTEQALAELYEVIAEFGSNFSNHYDRLLKRLPPGTVPDGNPMLLVAAAVAAYHDTKHTDLQPFPNVIPTLRALRKQGELTLGIVTEGLEAKQCEKLVRLGVVPYLDRSAIFISDQIGISKPNVKLYQRACADVGLTPRDVLYVGDHPFKDMVPAHSLGMGTVRFRYDGGKYARVECPVQPDHDIQDFADLIPIIRDQYGLHDLEG